MKSPKMTGLLRSISLAWVGWFALGCPRAGGLALYAADGAWHGLYPLPDAVVDPPAAQSMPGIRLHNHWVAL